MVSPGRFPGWRQLAACAAVGDQAVHQQHDKRAADGQQPGLQGEELLQTGAKDHSADPAAEECSNDAQHEGDEPAAALPAGKDRLSDRTSNKSENQECNKSHFSFLFLSKGGLRIPEALHPSASIVIMLTIHLPTPG